MASDSYGSTSTDAGLLRLAVAEAGTYRLEISNTRGTAGTIVGLVANALAPTPLALGTVQALNLAASGSSYFVATGATAGAPLAMTLDVTAAYLIATPLPAGPALGVNTTGSRVDARAWKPSARVLPLVEVVRNGSPGSGAAATLTLGAATAVAANTDVDFVSADSGKLNVLAYEGTALSTLSLGQVRTDDTGSTPALEVWSPAGVQVSNTYLSLTESGLYTLVLRSSGSTSAGAPVRLRVNELPEPTPISGSGDLVLDGTLAVGEVKRYRLALAKAQVVGLKLARNGGTLTGGAGWRSATVYDGEVSIGTPNPAAASGARFVQAAAPVAEVHVYPGATTLAEGQGAYRLTVQLPVPQPFAADTLLATTVPAGSLATWRVNQAADAATAWCLRATAPSTAETTALVPTLWGPSAPVSNYLGDLKSSTSDPGALQSALLHGTVRAGANTASLYNGSAAPVSVQMRVGANPPAADLVVGGAAGSGSLGACQRGYHRWPATIGTSYTVRVTAGFAGQVRITRQSGSDYQTHMERNPGVLSLAPGVERVITGTFSAGEAAGSAATFVVEVEGAADAGGSYTVSVTSP